MWLLEVNMGHLRSKLQLSVCMRDKRGCIRKRAPGWKMLYFFVLDNKIVTQLYIHANFKSKLLITFFV